MFLETNLRSIVRFLGDIIRLRNWVPKLPNCQTTPSKHFKIYVNNVTKYVNDCLTEILSSSWTWCFKKIVRNSVLIYSSHTQGLAIQHSQ